MRAAVVEAYGKPLVVASVPDPAPGPDDVVVRIERVAVNRTLDVEVHDSGAGWGVSPPLITGCDPAGEVVDAGREVTDLPEGSRVQVFPFLFDGTCRWCEAGVESACGRFGVVGVHLPGGDAEYIKVPRRNILRLPDAVGFDLAAAASLTYGVAYDLIVRRARLVAGETVLVWGAAGGVGSAAIDIGRMLGARIIAVGSSPERLAFAQRLGAAITVDRTRENVLEAVRDATHGEGVDLVVENIGTATFPISLSALAREGRLVTAGVVSGPSATIDIRALYRKHVALWFSAGFGRPVLERVLQGIADHEFHPQVTETYPLAEAEAAQDQIRSGRALSRILIAPQA